MLSLDIGHASTYTHHQPSITAPRVATSFSEPSRLRRVRSLSSSCVLKSNYGVLVSTISVVSRSSGWRTRLAVRRREERDSDRVHHQQEREEDANRRREEREEREADRILHGEEREEDVNRRREQLEADRVHYQQEQDDRAQRHNSIHKVPIIVSVLVAYVSLCLWFRPLAEYAQAS